MGRRPRGRVSSELVTSEASDAEGLSASIGQQIVVHGNATFGAMTVSVPASAGPSQGSGSRDACPIAESPAPPPRVDELTQHPQPLDAPVDVVIITAAEGEDTALLEVSEGALSPWAKIPSPEGYASEVYRATFESLTAPGTPIHVVTTRPPRMGGDHAGVAAGQLLGAFKPRCIAICGVCAGRPDWTALGDVIIADRVWRYDTGSPTNASASPSSTSSALPHHPESSSSTTRCSPSTPTATSTSSSNSNNSTPTSTASKPPTTRQRPCPPSPTSPRPPGTPPPSPAAA
jgi:Phosphorylase superfamily